MSYLKLTSEDETLICECFKISNKGLVPIKSIHFYLHFIKNLTLWIKISK